MADQPNPTPTPTPPPAPTPGSPAPDPALAGAAPPGGDAPHPRGEPRRDARGNLTRAGMEQVIREGGSVLHNGRVIGRVEALPSDADLAVGDEQATTAALDGLRAQREQLDAQERKLLAAKGAAAPKPAASPAPRR